MEIRNPNYLVEIARQKGISRAAEQLFVPQSTLSQYLLKLEAEVGTPLFLRDQLWQFSIFCFSHNAHRHG